ncbi:hypothetical protein ACWEKT_06840 [Nocardia takedensis]
MTDPKSGKHRRRSPRRTASFLVAGAVPVAVAIAAAPAFATPGGTAFVVDEEPAAPAPENAAPPVTTIRVGDIEVGRPDFVPPEIAQQINDTAQGMEDQLSDGLDAAGVDHARSDRIAEDVIGAAAIGASVGSTLSSPIAATSAMIGAATGVIVGFPFLPIGLVIGPVVCGAIGYAVIAAPAMAIGAGIGGVVGAIEGAMAPLPDQGAPQPGAPAV